MSPDAGRAGRNGGRGVRPPAVAGMFYPADPGELEATVRGLLSQAVPASGPLPAALVAPHAGYAYSGPVAGTAWALVSRARGHVRRVVLLGPSHHVAFQGMALPESAAFASPLGVHDVDAEGCAAVDALPWVRRWECPHRGEHSLEVHLPFLSVTLGRPLLLPLLTGAVAPDEVADTLERVWDSRTLVVVSTDLTHYLTYARARALDEDTAAAIEALDVDGVVGDRACGACALRGLLTAARRRRMHATTLDLRNSGDTSGSRDRVVGYGAFGFWRAA
jgi:MEMO1 family protein